MTAKELREKRAKLVPQMEEMRNRHHDPNHQWTDEDRSAWEKINAEYDDLSRQIDEAEAADDMDRRMAQIETEQRERNPGRQPVPGRDDFAPGNAPGQRDNAGPTEEDRAVAFQAWCRAQFGRPLEDRHEEAAQRVGLRMNQRELSLRLYRTDEHHRMASRLRSMHASRHRELLDPDRDARALSAVVGGSGGALVPETLIRSLEVNMLAYGGILQAADTIRTATGEPMGWPTADDTSNEGEQLGENTAAAVDGENSVAEVSFGKIMWGAYKFSSRVIKVPYELLEDSAFNLAGVLGQLLGERLGRILNRRCTVGDGAATCQGAITAAEVGVTAASATAILYDELVELEHSVDPAYRIGASYMLHDSIVLALRLLKDGEGRYLWWSGAAEGRPDRLNGRPVVVNQNMASAMVASADTVAFGDFSRYKIRQVNDIRLYRLEERYRELDQDGFVAFLRADGGLLNAGTCPIKKLRQGQ